MSFDPNSVLVLIDIQQAYSDVVDLENFQNNTKRLLQKARKKGIPVIHVHEIDDLKKSKWLSFWKEMKGDRTHDIGIPMDCAKPRIGEDRIIKHGYDAFYQTTLENVLRQRFTSNTKQTIYFAGLLTGVCVLNTIMSAFNRGYRVYLVENCCSDRLKTRHNMTLQYYQNYLFRKVVF